MCTEVISMVDMAKAKGLAKAISKEDGISSATLVSRSGMYIAGDVPQGAHAETFVAMAAILLGSGETAATEINEGLKSINVILNKSRLLIRGVTEKTLIVVHADKDMESEALEKILDKHLKGVEE